jgi:D-alanine transaminase
MHRISFVNGEFVTHEKAFVHIDDRGFLFADAVYEVILYYKNRLIDFDLHIARLRKSLQLIKINNFDVSDAKIKEIILELFAQNNLNTGSIYLQITRGNSPRNLTLPKNIEPTFIATVSPVKSSLTEETLVSIKVMTDIDMRWSNCNIKSVGLLASLLAKQKAIDLGFSDTVMVRDGFITEGTFSNLFIVDQNSTLITRGLDNYILGGITRERLLKLAQLNNICVEEREFSVDELYNAREAFLTSSTIGIVPISSVNDKTIGDGQIGNIVTKLLKLYLDFISMD